MYILENDRQIEMTELIEKIEEKGRGEPGQEVWSMEELGNLPKIPEIEPKEED